MRRDIAGRMCDCGINDPGTKRQVRAVYASPDRRPALAVVTVPTLVIHGTDDPLISSRASREVAEVYPAQGSSWSRAWATRFCSLTGSSWSV